MGHRGARGGLTFEVAPVPRRLSRPVAVATGEEDREVEEDKDEGTDNIRGAHREEEEEEEETDDGKDEDKG